MKKTAGERAFNIVNITIMVILCIICVYPLLYVLFASFSDPSQLAAHRGLLVKPLGFTFKGYEMVLQNQNILTGYANTLFYVVIGTFVNIMATSVAAYLMSRKRWAWSVPLMMMATFYMFFKGGLIPSYLLVKDLGLMNTRWALIIPSAITVWNLIILRTAFASVPDALEESARIDGASELRILFNIIIPVSKAAIAVQVLYYAVWHWNEWFYASIYLQDRELYPLQLFLRELLIAKEVKTMQDGTADMLMMDRYKDLMDYCTIIVATVPILLIYPLLQKHFVKGVMIGSVKG